MSSNFGITLEIITCTSQYYRQKNYSILHILFFLNPKMHERSNNMKQILTMRRQVRKNNKIRYGEFQNFGDTIYTATFMLIINIIFYLKPVKQFFRRP